MRLFTALVHYPVYNKNGETIASALTPIDLHDMARLGRTFGVIRSFVVTPLEDQQKLARRVVAHWTRGYGARYNPHRREAVRRLEVVLSVEAAVGRITEMEEAPPILAATAAGRQGSKTISYARMRRVLSGERAVLVLFGTAWGLERGLMRRVDHVLAPVKGAGDYNHLSVRTAAAIVLDRLAGRHGTE